jgi:hypothetical protein
MYKFVITREWLDACATKGCGWSDQQLAAIDCRDKSKGWKERLIGRCITSDQKRRFELLSKNKAAHQIAMESATNLDVVMKFLERISFDHDICVSEITGDNGCPHCWRSRLDNQHNNDYKFLTGEKEHGR